MRHPLLLAGLLLSCSAPELAPPGPPPPVGPEWKPPEVPSPPPPPEPGEPTEGSPLPAPVAAPMEPPPMAPTPSDSLPRPPFTAWTVTAPLTLVGPGGTNLAIIDRLGVRVEVEQVLEGRMRVRCAAIGAGEELEGWLPLDTVRAVGLLGPASDPLGAALRQRATWAGGAELPSGADTHGMCALIDHGFTLARDGRSATWSSPPASLELAYQSEGWSIGEVTGQAAGEDWSCRTERGPDGGGARPPNPG